MDKWFPLENNKLQLFCCLSLSTKNYENINIHKITKVADTLLIKIKDNFLFEEIREFKLFLIKYASDNTFETTSSSSFNKKWVQFLKETNAPKP